ncbi:MAG: NifB/NifX family molybdenum-iron cluster-binding protein [Candidatus Krumholzibacteriia bacterium]
MLESQAQSVRARDPRRSGVRELVVISGKGGTGKTSVAAALAMLAERPVVADCDVDAADLHLLLSPAVEARHEFRAGHEAVIDPARCLGCGECLRLCRYGAIARGAGPGGGAACVIDPLACEGCGVCVRFCPVEAIDFPESVCGEWMVSRARTGPMVHARLGVAAENSGKLVSLVRQEARRLAEAEGRSTVIVDGPPGVGCPVIASLTGAAQVLVVTEPTVAGEHDLVRVLALADHFGIAAAVCVNKWDINPELTRRIEAAAAAAGAQVVGRIRHDPGVTAAQLRKLTVVETGTACAEDVRAVWRDLGFAATGQESTLMKIAIPLVNGQLALHFGHCEQFALVNVDRQACAITGREDVGSPPHEPGLLPRWLAERGASMIIAGGMGQRARDLFTQQGIEVIVGAPPVAPETLVGSYLDGTLRGGENLCDH